MSETSGIPGITADIQAAIEAVIMNDEGGWSLSKDPDDGDGGWTYAGVTANTYRTVYSGFYNYSDIEGFIRTNLAEIKKRVFTIYYQRFYTHLILNPRADFSDMQLSCAINCGVATANNIALSAKSRIDFAHQWMLAYGTICKQNEVKIMYIHGWTNRVFRYLKEKEETPKLVA